MSVSVRRSARASARLEGVVQKCVPVLFPGSARWSPCGEEGRVRHAKKTKYGPQIRLTKLNEAIRV